MSVDQKGALMSECDGCGAPDGFLYMASEHGNEYQCPRCALKLAIYDAAAAHLHTLYAYSVEMWLEAWAGHDITSDLKDLSQLIGINVGERAASKN